MLATMLESTYNPLLLLVGGWCGNDDDELVMMILVPVFLFRDKAEIESRRARNGECDSQIDAKVT